jgi:stage III sporulation protein AH
MLSKKKKIFILVGMAVLLVVTGYVNVLLSSNAKASNNENLEAGNFFATYRADRQATRDQTMSYLTAIIDSTTGSAAAKAEAEEQKLKLTNAMTLESTLEGIIKSNGFEDCIVTAGTENINVIVKKGILSDDEVSIILSAVVNESGKEARYVKIIPVE